MKAEPSQTFPSAQKRKKKVSVAFVTLLFFESLAILSLLSICSWHSMPRILQLMVSIVTPAIELSKQNYILDARRQESEVLCIINR